MLSKIRDLNLDGDDDDPELTGGGNPNDTMIETLFNHIKDLVRQVNENKEWAHQKIIEAARKLSSDLTEFKILRYSIKETQELIMEKTILAFSRIGKFVEYCDVKPEFIRQKEGAYEAKRRLEAENAKMRAEIEACKLAASRSQARHCEAANRETKSWKKLLGSEKQKDKLLDEIAIAKAKIKELQQCMGEIEEAQNEAEAQWGVEEEAKEQTEAQVQEERSLNKAAKAKIKGKLKALRKKINKDVHSQKEHLQQLKEELSCLKSNNNNWRVRRKLHEEIGELGFIWERDSVWDCVICKMDQVSIVCVPCGHQVMCESCSENYGGAFCPWCLVRIEDRVRVH